MGLKKKNREKKAAEEKAAVKIPQHKHCFSCGKAVPPDKKTCSDACQAELDNRIRSQSMLKYMFYAMIAILLVSLGWTFIP